MNRNIIAGILGAILTIVLTLAFVPFARAADPDVAWREAVRAIVGSNGVVNVAIRDTNTTTDVTLRTPAFVGQILFGAAGGSNAIWLANAKSTNGWVKVDQK